MVSRALILGVLVLGTACDTTPEAVAVDLQVYPARLDESAQAPAPTGWRRVEFAGNARTPAGTFLVSEQALLTGWNLVALRGAANVDGSHSVAARLNAAGRRKLERFTSEPENLKTPLALRVDGRWADFSPLLRPPGDRVILYGLTGDEVERLERWIRVR